MGKNISDDSLEKAIRQAVIRKGEQQALSNLAKIGSGQELKHIMNNAERRHKPLLQKRIMWLSASAAAVIILILTIGLQPRYSTDELFASYYAPPAYEAAPPSRGGTTLNAEQQNQLALAIELYQSGRYREASGAFAKVLNLLSAEQISDDILFYAAVTFTEAGQYEKALSAFRHLSAISHSAYRDDALWMSALVLLENGQRQEALALLQQISNSTFSPKAKELVIKCKEKRWF